jgi:hypothetical protein
MKLRFSLLLIVFAWCGCALFSTRTPEPPNTSNTFIWTPATTVDYLMNNFIGTVQALDGTNYARVFISATDSTGSGSKSFTFTPRPGLDPSSRSIFTSWTPESERAWLAKLKTLLSANSQLSLLISNESPPDQSTNTATISGDYTLSIPITGSSSVIPSVVQGSFQMQLLLVTTDQGTKEWRIVSWSDFQPQSGSAGSTWTDLKVKLSS